MFVVLGSTVKMKATCGCPGVDWPRMDSSSGLQRRKDEQQ